MHKSSKMGMVRVLDEIEGGRWRYSTGSMYSKAKSGTRGTSYTQPYSIIRKFESEIQSTVEKSSIIYYNRVVGQVKSIFKRTKKL